jgi:predicted branched-subunit amino acid permease
MNPAIFGAFIGAFAISLGIAAIWLIISMIIPPLRKRPKGTYITAMVLCVLPQLITYGGPGPINFMAAIACVLLLVWQMKRTQKKLTSKSRSDSDATAQP